MENKKMPPASIPGAEANTQTVDNVALATKNASEQFNFTDIERHLKYLMSDGGKYQVRHIGGGLTTTYTLQSCKREDLDKCREWMNRQPGGGAWYVGINPTTAETGTCQNKTTTTGRAHLYIDVDPERHTGTAATEQERAAARAVVDCAAAFLEKRGLPAPLFNDSGNGFHLLYKLPSGIPADDGGAVRTITGMLAAKFSTQAAKIDAQVTDAPRIMRLAGTLNSKGDDSPERPRRMAAVISAPDCPAQISAFTWGGLLSDAPADGKSTNANAGTGPGLIPEEDPMHGEALTEFNRYLDRQEEAQEGERNQCVNRWLCEAKRRGIQANAALQAIVDSGKDGGYCSDPNENAGAVARSVYSSPTIPAGDKSALMFDVNEAYSRDKLKDKENAERQRLLNIIRACTFTETEFRETEPPPGEWVVNDGWPFERGTLQTLFAPGGGGKSSISTQFCLAVAHGLPFLGRQISLRADGKRYKCVYITVEETKPDVHRRVYRQVEKAEEYAKKPIDRVIETGESDFEANPDTLPASIPYSPTKFIVLPPDSVLVEARINPATRMLEYNVSAFGEMLADELRRDGADIVFLDNLARLFPGGENDRNQVSEFNKRIAAFAWRAGVMVILLAHTNRGGSYSGSTDWNNSSRARMIITPRGTGKNKIYKLVVEKVNGAAEGLAFYFEWYGGWWFKAATESDWSQVETAQRAEHRDELGAEIVKVLADNRAGMGETDIRNQLNTSDPPIETGGLRTALKQLTSEKKIEKTTGRSRQVVYKLPDNGGLSA
ncbi:MAG: AAA family ATPase [Victivallaceae bacterium]|nr:AAA family ATPase [Victivallaceae bacterium]